jgi:hypothetical protein
MGRTRTVVVMCVALLALLTGCGSATPAAVCAQPPLDFRGTTVDGAAFDGSTLGGVPVVLSFWAPF